MGKGAFFTRRAHALLSKTAEHFTDIASPVRRQISACDVMLETTVRPITDAPDQPMLHRVEMDIVNVTSEISLVANRVLPIPALP